MGWVSAKPSIAKDLKALGFSDTDIKKVLNAPKDDRKALKAEVDKLIKQKKEKEAAVKKLFSDMHIY